MKKYELTDETKFFCGKPLHRIVALRDFGSVKKGDKGGWIEKEENLSHEGNCWVYDEARVSGNAKVCDNAKIYDYVIVYNNARVCNNAKIFDHVISGGNSYVYGNAVIYGKITISGSTEISGFVEVVGEAKIYNAIISSIVDYIVFKNWWSSGRYFTWTRSNNMWSVGCFYGTGDELIKKAYEDSEDKGKHYEEIVEYVNKCVLGKG